METLDVSTGEFTKNSSCNNISGSVHTALYLKDKFSISNSGYHQLSMISDLPNSTQVKKCTTNLNSQFEIQDAPEGIVGVQQKIKPRLQLLLSNMIKNAEQNDKPLPKTIRVKLTGDGTQIGRGLNVVNVAFSILEEEEIVMSVRGSHCIAILKVSEANYDELLSGLKDIINEARDLQCVAVVDTVFKLNTIWAEI